MAIMVSTFNNEIAAIGKKLLFDKSEPALS
jgi:hypothetical protein